jgi:hypothetical protein
VDATPSQTNRYLWAFWIACALAVAGAVLPYVLSGGSGRVNGALIPFALAAVAFAASALIHQPTRPVAAALYFFASLAIVYGILAMLALPMRLAVLGTCPGPGPCSLGLERAITSSETTALNFGMGMGVLAILAGFIGLRMEYRRYRKRQQAAAPPTPPVRRIPPVSPQSQADTPPAPVEASVAVAEAPAQPEPQAELPAHTPDLELPAHAAAKAPDGSQPEDAPTRPRRPRPQRKPKATPDPPPSTP